MVICRKSRSSHRMRLPAFGPWRTSYGSKRAPRCLSRGCTAMDTITNAMSGSGASGESKRPGCPGCGSTWERDSIECVYSSRSNGMIDLQALLDEREIVRALSLFARILDTKQWDKLPDV